MPPARGRPTNVQGRQKACSECAKGKRKCDLSEPSCTRCRRQQLTCIYPQSPEQSSLASRNDLRETPGDFEVPDLPMNLEDIENAALSMDFDLDFLQPTCSADGGDFDLSAGISSLESLSHVLYSPPNDDDCLVIERPRHHVGQSFSATHIAPAAMSRAAWSIDQLKLAPRMMVEQNGTPWQHSMLYADHMPRALQDAHAACALYNARNGVNDELISRIIGERVEEMVASPSPEQPKDLLARAHALMLYQVMLVFGGDVRYCSLAECLLPLMEQAGTALLSLSAQQIDPTGQLPIYPSTAARAAWASYILRESSRRTILSLYHFAALCHLLRGQYMRCDNLLALGNRVTLSAHLWNAKSAFDYAIAWNNKKHFVVDELDFTEVLRDAKPEDIDTFAKMIMIGLQGEDEVRGWLYTKGGTL